jgi:hypothetical protein
MGKYRGRTKELKFTTIGCHGNGVKPWSVNKNFNAYFIRWLCWWNNGLMMILITNQGWTPSAFDPICFSAALPFQPGWDGGNVKLWKIVRYYWIFRTQIYTNLHWYQKKKNFIQKKFMTMTSKHNAQGCLNCEL